VLLYMHVVTVKFVVLVIDSLSNTATSVDLSNSHIDVSSDDNDQSS